VPVPIGVIGDKRVVRLEANPGPLSAPPGRVLGQLLGLPEERTHAVVVDCDVVQLAEDACDGLGSLLVKSVEFEYPADEIRGGLGVGPAPWRLDRRERAGFTRVVCDLLDAAPAAFVPIGDILGVGLVMDSDPTDPVDSIPASPRHDAARVHSIEESVPGLHGSRRGEHQRLIRPGVDVSHVSSRRW
jgi:hypothetical protein